MSAAPAFSLSGQRSVVDEVAEALLGQILDGDLGPGSRLPAERDLAMQLGVSRVSVRAAVRRLIDWGVVITRQGSGASVQQRAHWSAGVLGPVMLHGMLRANWAGLVPLVNDALETRRSLVLNLIERAADALAGRSLDRVRQRLEETWACRDDPVAFAMHDVRIIPSVLEAADMHASLWLINSMSEAYVGVMSTVAASARVPGTYLEANLAIMDALERGDGKHARALQAEYLEKVDERILQALPPDLRRLMRKKRTRT